LITSDARDGIWIKHTNQTLNKLLIMTDKQVDEKTIDMRGLRVTIQEENQTKSAKPVSEERRARGNVVYNSPT
jgi:hypothetical protein